MVRAFILGAEDIYDLLLFKRWMHRVRAVEDHHAATLTLEGKDGVKRTIRGREAEPSGVGKDIVGGPSVDEWETAIAEEELARLAEELNGIDYIADMGKVLHH